MLAPKLKFDNVSKTYNHKGPQPVSVLENLNFELFAEEFVCILGPSGSGKTTILGLVAGFIKPTSGNVTFNSKKVQRPDSTRTLVFQDFALFPWLDVLDNVAFGLTTKINDKNKAREEAKHYLELVGLMKYKDYPISELSGGMKQRLAIARALAVEPEVLLLDEPFGSLDEQTRANMQVEILRLWSKAKKTVLFVTNSVDEALKLADRILVVGGNPGKLLFDTTVSVSRPRNFSDVKLAKIRNQLIDRLSQPEYFMGADI